MDRISEGRNSTFLPFFFLQIISRNFFDSALSQFLKYKDHISCSISLSFLSFISEGEIPTVWKMQRKKILEVKGCEKSIILHGHSSSANYKMAILLWQESLGVTIHK